MATFREYVATLEVTYTDSQGRDWFDMETGDMSTLAQAAYEAYREANRLAAQARDKFESVLKAAIEEKAIKFGYKYGKLSFTMLDTAPKAKATGGKAKVSLSAWQDERRAHNAAAS